MAERALGELGATGELRVRVVNDAEMIALHERWSNDPSTTDVLTFDLSEGASARTRALDGDLIVCYDEALRRAAGRVERELLLYVVHGALHCLGYDDRDEVGASAMHEREDEVLERIGVGRVYSGGTA